MRCARAGVGAGTQCRRDRGAQQVEIRFESQRSTLATLQTSLDRASDRSRQLEERRSDLERQLVEGEAPLR